MKNVRVVENGIQAKEVIEQFLKKSAYSIIIYSSPTVRLFSLTL
ncbi:hypothetical protein ACQCPQ_27920 (plasmid) [Priestia megaterium]